MPNHYLCCRFDMANKVTSFVAILTLSPFLKGSKLSFLHLLFCISVLGSKEILPHVTFSDAFVS